MEKPITILIPCFNGAEFLEQALDSILNQTYSNILILLLDDGSSDESLSIAEGYSKRDGRVKIHRNTVNQGIIASRNKLLELCETELAAWMDADDIAAPERIEKQVAKMQENPNWIACSCKYIQLENDKQKNINLHPIQLSKEYLLFYNHVLNPGSMFRASVCKEMQIRFRTWISGASDFQFWVEMSKYGEIGLLDEFLMTYRVHQAQETKAQKFRQSKGGLEIIQAQLKDLGCESELDVLSRMLIYPAETLGEKFHYKHLISSASTTKRLLQCVEKSDLNYEIVEALLFNMFRKQAWRNGSRGVFKFVRFYGLSGLAKCKYFGFDLLIHGFKADIHEFSKLFVNKSVSTKSLI